MYYLLEVNFFAKPPPYRTRFKSDAFKLQPSRWITGRPMDLGDKHLDIDLRGRHESALPEIFLDSVPMFRRDVFDTMTKLGIDNIQTCPVTLRYPSGEEIADQNYLAVNIVGAVQCADLEKSEYDDVTGTGAATMGFRKLVIDEEQAAGTLLFRLAEAMASIVVHRKVKEHLEAEGFQYFSFRPLARSQPLPR